ncbi:hypothetical protein HDK77DRAFT_485540 [Phyllosticta capitalensis]
MASLIEHFRSFQQAMLRVLLGNNRANEDAQPQDNIPRMETAGSFQGVLTPPEERQNGNQQHEGSEAAAGMSLEKQSNGQKKRVLEPAADEPNKKQKHANLAKEPKSALSEPTDALVQLDKALRLVTWERNGARFKLLNTRNDLREVEHERDQAIQKWKKADKQLKAAQVACSNMVRERNRAIENLRAMEIERDTAVRESKDRLKSLEAHRKDHVTLAAENRKLRETLEQREEAVRIAVRRQNKAIQERDTAAQKCDAAEEDARKQRASYSRLEDSLKHFQATFNKNDPRFDTDLIKEEEV